MTHSFQVVKTEHVHEVKQPFSRSSVAPRIFIDRCHCPWKRLLTPSLVKCRERTIDNTACPTSWREPLVVFPFRPLPFVGENRDWEAEVLLISLSNSVIRHTSVIEINFALYLFNVPSYFASNENEETSEQDAITPLSMAIPVTRNDVTCSICGQLYTNPALIPSCGHSFDLQCIVRLVHCPVESCRTPVIPVTLIPNQRLKGLVEGYQQSNTCTHEIFLLDSSKSMWYSDSFLGLFGQSRFDMAIQFLQTTFAQR